MMSVLLALVAFGAPAAFGQAYPTNTPLLLASSNTPPAGSQLTLVAEGFVPGASVTFTYSLVPGSNTAAVRTPNLATNGTFGTAVADAAGTATLVATAPSLAGTFLVTASSPDGRSASTTITILALASGGSTSGLPTTGADFGSTTLTAGALLLVGVGLVGGVAIRRRSRSAAAH